MYTHICMHHVDSGRTRQGKKLKFASRIQGQDQASCLRPFLNLKSALLRKPGLVNCPRWKATGFGMHCSAKKCAATIS